VLQCAAVCCSALQCVTVCYSVLQCIAMYRSVLQRVAARYSVLQCAQVCCSECCRLLQYGVAVSCKDILRVGVSLCPPLCAGVCRVCRCVSVSFCCVGCQKLYVLQAGRCVSVSFCVRRLRAATRRRGINTIYKGII